MKSSAWGKNLPPVLSTMKREKEVFFTFFAVVLISRKLYSIFHSTSHRQEGPYSKVCTHNTLTYTLFLTRKMEFAGYRNHFLDQDRSWYAHASQYARPHCRMLARAATPCRPTHRCFGAPGRPLAPPSGRFGLSYCNFEMANSIPKWQFHIVIYAWKFQKFKFRNGKATFSKVPKFLLSSTYVAK